MTAKIEVKKIVTGDVSPTVDSKGGIESVVRMLRSVGGLFWGNAWSISSIQKEVSPP